ncbi:MAG: DNA repair protein RecN [Clostridia bacterium]|nr:DNA repair protein RecN [Clostridia bacterium]
MLRSLYIKNIALFEECKVTLGEGLNVLSGETGAGKSLVIDSLIFVLGGKTDKSLIRYGEKSAMVEAVFEVDEDSPVFDELGIERDNVIIVKRTMTESKNDVRVNGEVFSLGMLRKLTAQAVDILGQHEHQSLLKTSAHLKLLDKYDPDIENVKADYLSTYSEYKRFSAALEDFGDDAYRERRKEILEFQIEDIKKVDPKVDEEDELIKKRDKYRNSEKFVEGVSGAYNALDSDEIGVGVLIARALQSLRPVSKFDDGIEEIERRLEEAKIELEDIRDTLSSYAEDFEYDPREAERIERRVDAIKSLKRKYGGSVENVLEFLKEAEAEYEELTGADEKIEDLKNELSKCLTSLYKKAKALSDKRRETAVKFEKAIIKELNDLAMKGTRFQASFNEFPSFEDFEDALTENGVDEVEFLISPNVGEPLRSLSKIASGGEMSRFMLAVKNITADLEGIDAMVFDEIDTGISGKVAETVAEKLYNISVGRQVIAVTHLPQLASFADNHYLISKSVTDGKTHTSVVLLSEEDKIKEVARLAGADTAAAKEHAKEMIKRANEYKGKVKK